MMLSGDVVCVMEMFTVCLITSGGLLEASPYTVGDMTTGLPIVNSIPNASMLGMGNANYVTSRYVVGTQPAIIQSYTGGGCGDGLMSYTSANRLNNVAYSR